MDFAKKFEFSEGPDYNSGLYKTYVALLTQSGTSAPAATVLQNSLGFTPIYTYNLTGNYSISGGTFSSSNTSVLISNGTGKFVAAVFGLSNTIVLTTQDNSNTSQNGYLTNNTIEIRIYS